MTRGRKPLVNPTVSKDIHFDAALITRAELLLFSEAEGRVPKGAYQRFFNHLLASFFDTREMDLSPYAGTLPGEMTVRGRPEVIDRLKQLLEKGGA